MKEFFYCILQMSLDASYLIVAVILIRFLIRKSSKLFRKILWFLVGSRLVVPFSFESVLSLVPARATVASVGNSGGASLNASAVSEAAEATVGFEDIVPYLWLAVAVVFVILGLVSFIRLKRKISDAVLLKKRVYQSEKVDSPFVCGLIKPKIYVPYKIDEDTLNFVLKHENTHIKCFDHILKVIGFLILCVHWFNPLVWVSYILFCKDTELFCDEVVVRNMSEENRRKYALALCDIGVEKTRISACPVAFGEVGIKERVKHAVNYQKTGIAIATASVVACVVVTLCFMTTPVEAELKNADENKKTQEVRETEPKKATEIVEETTVPVTEATEPVTEPTTEPVTEPVTEPATEYVAEATAETYSETEEIIYPSIEDEEYRPWEIKYYYHQQQEAEEYARKQQLAGYQSSYNETAGGPVHYNSQFGYNNNYGNASVGGAHTPSITLFPDF